MIEQKDGSGSGMIDEQIVKALECCSEECKCNDCSYDGDCIKELTTDALALVKRQMAEIRSLEYTLLGVMHFVDKWLEGEELEQDEVSRAITMREKTLRIIENLQAEIAEKERKV
jgi:hypothetical protein